MTQLVPRSEEAVGDPAGGDVAEQAGERVLLPGDAARVGDPLDDRFGGVVGDPRGACDASSRDRVPSF